MRAIVKPQSEMCSQQLTRLLDKIFAGDDKACFVERDESIYKLSPDDTLTYANVFESILDGVSTPVDHDDVFLGRVKEGPLPAGAQHSAIHRLLNTAAHMTLDWPALLEKGLLGILADAQKNAEHNKFPDAKRFVQEAQDCIFAVERFAQRYSQAAMQQAQLADSPEIRERLIRSADALRQVPMNPATDFFSALQSIWIIHLITSCYIGGRDFAFGRMDQYLLPFYQRDIETGRLNPAQAVELLAFFFVKTNEITGLATWDYNEKPTPCFATKQYLIISGQDADGNDQTNDLSYLILDAASLIEMPQPVLTVRLHDKTPKEFKTHMAKATLVVKSQIHFYNDNVVIPGLSKLNLSREEIADYSMVGCCRFDIPGAMDVGSSYNYMNVVQWLVETLHSSDDVPGGFKSFQQILDQFSLVCNQKITEHAKLLSEQLAPDNQQPVFRFESLLLNDCISKCKDYFRGGVRYRPQGYFWGGIATVADSLIAVKKLVFDNREMTLRELLEIVDNNFKDNEKLRQKIVSTCPKFGNDDEEVDSIACEVGEILLDALDAVEVPDGQLKISGFYSLNTHYGLAQNMRATPDGRLAGEPYSENQSPSYGSDTNGMTALLKSVSRLPLSRTQMGGLNLKFAGNISHEKLLSLLETAFDMGCLHVGFTFVDRNTLQAARKNPEQYRTLQVRPYGFSEYFTSLSPQQQIELIQRSEY